MRILVVDLLGGLGDMIMALPAVHALAARHRGAEVTVLTHAASAVLLARDPAVAAVRVAERHAERAAVGAALADLAPDLAVTTTRFDDIGDLLDADAAARGTRAATDLWRRPPPDQLVGHRYLAILAAQGLVDPREATRPRPPRVVLGDDERAAGRADLTAVLDAGPGRAVRAPLVLVPDAGMAVKRWPAGRWADLAARAAGRGRPVLAVASADGTAVSDATALPPADLRRLAARFAAAGERGGVVVGPDTGPVRLAAAVGAPTVALFGPTLAARYGLEEGTNVQGFPGCPHRRPTAITEQVCWWEAACPLSDTGPACLEDLGVEEVAARVERLLTG